MNIEVTKEGKILCNGKERKLENRNGYLRVGINRKNYSVHRLVAEKYIPNPFNKPFVNHKNGLKSDNRIDNLEWVTQEENIIHSALVLGNTHKRKFSWKEISEIRSKYIPNEYSIAKLAKEYNTHSRSIQLIINNKTYKTQ
jgi:hypothetical protein